jgi:uncharacterized RDD family membrane protein YckC
MVNSGQQGLMSLIPMIVLLLAIITIVIWIKRSKRRDEIVIQKEKITSFPRILFGCLLILIGVGLLSDVTLKLSQGNLPVFFSSIFTALVITTGGIRILKKTKPTIDDDGTIYADFGKRFWANTIDVLLLMAVFYTGHLLLDKVSYLSFVLVTTLITIIADGFVVWLLSKYHATPGKMLMGLVVKTVDKNNVTVKNAILRSSVDLVFALLYGIAFLISLKSFSYSEFKSLPYFKGISYSASHFPIWHKYMIALSQFWFWSELAFLMFNKKRRAVHDFIAGTIVIESISHKEIER